MDINNQIKETICTINLQYYLLQAAGRGSLVSWAGTKKACYVYVLISTVAVASTYDKSLS